MKQKLKKYAEYLLTFTPEEGRLRLNLESYIHSGYVKELIPLHSNYEWKRNMLEVFAQDLRSYLNLEVDNFEQFIKKN